MMQQVTTQEECIKGLSLSPGLAIGKLCYYESLTKPKMDQELLPFDPRKEKKVFRKALKQGLIELYELKSRAEKEENSELKLIIDAHTLIISDPELIHSIEESIDKNGIYLKEALLQTLNKWSQSFLTMPDPYLRERYYDFQDVIRRLLRILENPSPIAWPEEMILYCEEGLPLACVEAPGQSLKAIVTQRGASGSHLAILSRARRIPCLSHIYLNQDQSLQNSEVIIDGNKGWLILNPSSETKIRYLEKLQRDQESKSSQSKFLGKVLKTLDAKRVYVQANIDSLEDIKALDGMNIDGIGLVRTELLMMRKNTLPDELSQRDIYEKVVDAVKGKKVTLRLFDLGSDKPFLSKMIDRETNPALGCRGIRFLLQEILILKQQLRAILACSNRKRIKILVPMVSCESEMIQVRKILKECANELGIVEEDLPELGCMIEVPSAALMVDRLAIHSDFFSVGTNDLIQYTLATDRCEQGIHDLYNPLNPSILRLISLAVNMAKKHKRPLSVCGEMAGDFQCREVLLGLGVRNFSMAIAYINDFQLNISQRDSNEAKRLAMSMIFKA